MASPMRPRPVSMRSSAACVSAGSAARIESRAARFTPLTSLLSACNCVSTVTRSSSAWANCRCMATACHTAMPAIATINRHTTPKPNPSRAPTPRWRRRTGATSAGVLSMIQTAPGRAVECPRGNASGASQGAGSGSVRRRRMSATRAGRRCVVRIDAPHTRDAVEQIEHRAVLDRVGHRPQAHAIALGRLLDLPRAAGQTDDAGIQPLHEAAQLLGSVVQRVERDEHHGSVHRLQRVQHLTRGGQRLRAGGAAMREAEEHQHRAASHTRQREAAALMVDQVERAADVGRRFAAVPRHWLRERSGCGCEPSQTGAARRPDRQRRDHGVRRRSQGATLITMRMSGWIAHSISNLPGLEKVTAFICPPP